MSNIQYPKEQTDFLQAVWEMREAQRSYFSHKTEARLKLAKIKEQRVDSLVRKYISAGVISTANNTTKVVELFT